MVTVEFVEKRTKSGWKRKTIRKMVVILFVMAMSWITYLDNMRMANNAKTVSGKKLEKTYTVVLDAGHGGSDPGKIGINEAMEKDVNLQIVLRLKRYLEEAGVRVVLTRTGDEGLYDAEEPNKKVQDMKRRIEIIEGSGADMAVSIHQNSYPEEAIHGAQVFYYETSREGKQIAENIQDALRELLDPNNKRQVKANTSYYLLKKTTVPLVIAECGFLSNREEADKLCCEEYQEQLAKAVSLGILEYLEEKNTGKKLS